MCFIKKSMSFAARKREDKRQRRDQRMRRKLLEFLQDGTRPEGEWLRPEPMRDDEQVQQELKRILRG